MKKFKLIALGLLASTFGLTSCELPAGVKKLIPWGDKGQKEEQKEDESKGEVVSVKIKNEVSKITDETEPFKLIAHVEVKDNASKEVTWTSSNSSVATVAADGMVTPKGAGSVTFTATSKQDSSKKDSITVEVVVVPGVASVVISDLPDVAYLHRSCSLSAVVAGKGQFSHGVTWSSSNEEVATVSDKGVVTYLKAGSVTITATSKFDKSKKGTATIEVVDGGLHPEYIAEGYSYSKALPVSTIDNYSGTVAHFPSFDTEEGFYIIAGSTSGGNTYLNLVFDATYDNYYAALDALEAGEYYYFVDRYYELDCFMDPEQLLEVDFDFDESPDGYDMISFSFYHTADIFKGSNDDTTDEAWNESVSAILTELNIDLPFVKLGADYAGEQDDYSIEISDNSADFNKLNGYDEVLNAAGFAVDEEFVYSKAIDSYSHVEVEFGFTEAGNTIIASNELTELDAFPASEVAAYVASFPSKYSVPTLAKSGAKFTYDQNSTATDTDNKEVPCVTVGVTGVSEEDCEDYIGLFVADDYEVLGSTEHYIGSSDVLLRKGKIQVEAEIAFDYHAADEDEIAEFEAITEADYEAMTQAEKDLYDLQYMYYLFYGTFPVFDYDTVTGAYISIYCFEPGMEDPGIYIYESAISIDKEETFTIEPIHYEIDSELAVSYVSSDPSVATVDENGVITGVEFGEAVVTASVTDPDLGELSDSVAVTVEHLPTMADVAAQINAVLESLEIEDRIELPEMDNFVFGEFDASDFEDYGVFYLTCSTTETEESYCEKLEAIGYTITLDDYGYPIANNGVFEIEPFVYGDMYLYITYLGGSEQAVEFTDAVVFSELGYSNEEEVSDVVLDYVTISFDVGSGTVTPKYFNTGTGVRVYQSNTITISVDGELDSIVFTMSQNNKAMTADCGTWDSAKLTWSSGGESISSVTFTIESGSGHNRITGMTVTGYGYPAGGGGGGDTDNVAYQIMYDVGVAGWGYVEDGDFKDPDSDGVIEANYTIGWDDVESPEDSETCLNGVLREFINDSDFPSYLKVVQGPTYTANAIESSIGVSEVYLVTSDYEYVLYMYDYYYDGEVSIVFMAGPYDAFVG